MGRSAGGLGQKSQPQLPGLVAPLMPCPVERVLAFQEPVRPLHTALCADGHPAGRPRTNQRWESRHHAARRPFWVPRLAAGPRQVHPITWRALFDGASCFGLLVDDAGVSGRQWQDLEPMEVQRVVAALLVRMLPGAQAIDGSGGDDGADVVALTGDGAEVFEIKSFARRLTRGQKRQIRESLERARDSRPEMTKWTLAVPLDPSPAEERWLNDELQALVDVPVRWMGLTELESALAEHPHIAREFWPGSTERRAMDLLASYHQERAALEAGVPDAIERGQKLRGLLGEVDPDFDFDIQLSDGQTVIGVRPRDDQALTRHPIGGTLTFEAPPGSPELDKINDFLTYGVALELDAPFVSATVRGLPGGLEQILDGASTTGIQIGPTSSPARSGRLTALAGGLVVNRLPVAVTEHSSGVAGGIRIVAEDPLSDRLV